MKNKFYGLSLLLLLALVSNADAQQTAKCKDEIKYDRFTDTTKVVCPVLKVSNDLDVNVITDYQGEKYTTPGKIYFSLFHMEKNPTPNVKFKYQDADTLYILADSGRAQVPISNYKHNDPRFLLIETASAYLTLDDLSLLLKAKTSEGRWGPTEFKFTDDSLKALQDFITRYTVQTSR